jgi:hypothetical protein
MRMDSSEEICERRCDEKNRPNVPGTSGLSTRVILRLSTVMFPVFDLVYSTIAVLQLAIYLIPF